LLYATPLAKGLFSTALIESGGCLVGSKASRQTQGESIATSLGCTDPASVLSCLRDKPATDFLTSPPSGVSQFLFTDTERAWEMLYGPNQDGYLFTEPPMESIKAGHGSVAPLAVGTNANEFDLFVPVGTINTCLDYATAVSALYPAAVAAEVQALYPCLAYPTPRFALTAAGTDFMFTCWARRIARAALQGGAPSVHRYLNPHVYTDSPLTPLRAFHASELPFVFETYEVFGYTPTPGDAVASSAFQDYWSRFAATGDPNGAPEITWPLYDQTDPVVVIDSTLSTQVGVNTTQCDYWDSIAEE
jgi:para-nitrobenzyl esterase